MPNILLTGGRTPVALDLARAFHRAGHVVYMAESLHGHLSEPSNVIEENIIVPPPRQKTAEFIGALKAIIAQYKIDLLIPTGEEVFYVSTGRDQLPCRVFADSIEKLRALHNRWRFLHIATGLGLVVPESALVNNLDDLLLAYAHWRGLVLKPVYSHFAAPAKILLPLKKALSTLTYESPRIAQEYVRGRQIGTYSVCHNGHISAHTAYLSEFTAGQGAPIAFRHIDHHAAFTWVEKFVGAMQFTGQIGFDFIQTPDERIFGIECYPHATGGLHNLSEQPGFTDSFFNETMPTLIPNNHRPSYMLSTALFVHGLPASIRHGHFIKWLRTFWDSKDVVLDDRDLKPFLLQFKSVFSYLKLAQEHQISPLEAPSFDIEWNGEKESQ
jgi:hypothetical protein